MAYASRLMLTLLHRNFRKAGQNLSQEQWILLLTLWHSESKGISQQELGKRTGKDKASITRLLHGLEEAGLVSRKPDPDDARIRLVCATPKSRKLDEVARKVLHDTVATVQDGLSPEEIDHLKSLVSRLVTNTELALGRHPHPDLGAHPLLNDIEGDPSL